MRGESLLFRLALAFAALTLCAAPQAPAQEAPAQEKGAAPAPAPAERPAAAPQPAATAADAAKDYTRKMVSSKPSEAVRSYWDMDAMLTGIFGEHLRRHDDKERAEMQRLLLEFIEKVYANPKVAQAMRSAKFENFTTAEGKSPDTATVSFDVRFDDKVIPNSLEMRRVDGKWRVIDAGTNGRMMVPEIREQYLPQAKRVTPLQYIREMAATI